MTHGYDIKTAFDFFRKLLDEREDYLKTPTSARYAINCAITAWQLHEWFFADRSKYSFMNQFKGKSDFRNFLYQEKDFRTVHDLADGGKHFELTKRKTTILETKLSSWRQISTRRLLNDNNPQLFLRVRFDKDSWIMSFDDLLYSITWHWCNFFADKLQEEVNSLFDTYGHTYL